MASDTFRSNVDTMGPNEAKAGTRTVESFRTDAHNTGHLG